SATSRQNTKDQVYAQNEMLAYQQKESTARVASIMENTNLSKQQQVSEIMRQMLTQAQTAGQYFTNHRNFTRRQVAIQNRVASNIGISQSTFSVKVLNLFSRSRRKTNKRKSKHSAMLRNKE